MAATFAEVAQAKYLLLTTFTKDGRPKPTAIWGVPDGDKLLVITDDGSWKVKRIRNTPRVTIAECDRTGKVKGEPVEAVASVLAQLAEQGDDGRATSHGVEHRQIVLGIAEAGLVEPDGVAPTEGGRARRGRVDSQSTRCHRGHPDVLAEQWRNPRPQAERQGCGQRDPERHHAAAHVAVMPPDAQPPHDRHLRRDLPLGSWT